MLDRTIPFCNTIRNGCRKITRTIYFEITGQDILDLWGCRDEEICNAGRYAGCI